MQTAHDIPTADTAAAIPAPARSRLSDFYELTKPRMNFLVLVTTMVGFYLASSSPNWLLCFNTMLGTALVAAASSVFNQLWEREFDRRMVRTMRRPIAAGRVAPAEAALFGAALGIVGSLYLLLTVNTLTAILGISTLLLYVLVYTPLKRVTSLCTIVGAVPGAIPPMMGWTAVLNYISIEPITLFVILFVWQMPHFLAIAVMYARDYEDAGFKMLPVVDDPTHSATGRQVIIYTLTMIPASLLPVMAGFAGDVYALSALLLGGVFLWHAIQLAKNYGYENAKRLFITSILYLPVLLAMLLINRV